MSLLDELGTDPVVGAAVWFSMALAAWMLRTLARRRPLGPRLSSAFSFIVAGLVGGGVEVLVRASGFAAPLPYLNAAALTLLAIGIVRAGLALFVDLYVRQRRGATVSSIFLDVANVVAYFVVILVVLRSTLNINLASLVATSAVLTAIVGLALQDVLSNLFSGLVLELEQSFTPGDWVRVGTFEGVIIETRWRTTKMRTRANEMVTLPNASLSKEAVVNYSRPDAHLAEIVRFEADYDTPPNVAKEAALGVLEAEPAVTRTPPPEVRLERYAESGIGYALRYWITEFSEAERIRSRIMTNLWYALRRHSVRIPFAVRDVYLYRGQQSARTAAVPDPVSTLRSVPLLAALDDAALQRLAKGVRRLTFGRDEVVIREGDLGDCFYVIESGQAEVMLEDGRAPRSLGRLYPGSIFGEMSVLAGEPRAATVRATSDLHVLVVDRDLFKDVIANNPALLEPLSQIAARRLAALEEQRRLLTVPQSADVDSQEVRNLRERIRGFFGL
jgi:small-conductance mechanosensitive channel/CRP-like cAMP-binding protein